MNKYIRKTFGWVYRPILGYFEQKNSRRRVREEISFLSIIAKQKGCRPRVFYLGITNHSNLGDLAQHYCIKKWITEKYPEHELIMFEADTVVNKHYKFIDTFKNIYSTDDIIVFQSGYTTQDLGGVHECMHRLVIENIPKAHILMMPQTIFFKKEENRKRCAENHNKAKKMLFLARDHVSYEQAKRMFPNIRVMEFPDIVTTLIGMFHFNHSRSGICICTRNDGEKLYSKAQIDKMADRICADGVGVEQKDTQAKISIETIRQDLKKYIESEIESYSHYEVTLTDRYHGTIFSLCAGTPVIILKTNDHKVVTGADWFKGVYDDYVYVAEDLDDAYNLCQTVRAKKLNHNLPPYFKQTYYDKLKDYFESL